jgi:hypothetical protein
VSGLCETALAPMAQKTDQADLFGGIALGVATLASPLGSQYSDLIHATAEIRIGSIGISRNIGILEYCPPKAKVRSSKLLGRANKIMSKSLRRRARGTLTTNSLFDSDVARRSWRPPE